MTPEQSVRLTYEAYNNRDLETALSQLDSKVQWDNGEGAMLQGVAAVADHWQQQWQQAEAKVVIDSMEWDSRDLILRVTLETKEPTGAASVNEVRNVIRFTEDRIVSMRIA